ncbi:MAG: glutamate mutase L, partial [Oscillospiraceae bacterium]
LHSALTLFENAPEALPEDEDGIKIDTALAKAAISLSAQRHAGTIETIFTPMGEKYMQTGKDLSQVRYLIGTGGSIICSEHPLDILEQGKWSESTPFSLLPKQAKPVIDKSYILSAMGLLSRVYPEIALEIMKKCVIGEENL